MGETERVTSVPDLPQTPSPDGRVYAVRWHLVVPVKGGSGGKSRLAPPAGVGRDALALALAGDTVAAACAAVGGAQVTVVTADPRVADLARGVGALVVPDPGAGLNAAVVAGWAQREHGSDAHPGWAALLGDLPALRAEDLGTALEACGALAEAFVPDADGAGTVLLTSTVSRPTPRFGPGSAARHGESAARLDLDLPRLRRDVDTAGDLARVVALGAGPRTQHLLGAGGSA